MSKYETYKKEVIDKRQGNRNKNVQTRAMRRQLGRKNMQPKRITQSEIQRRMVQNGNLIQSLKKELILEKQKTQLLQQQVKEIQEQLDYNKSDSGLVADKLEAATADESGDKPHLTPNNAEKFEAETGKKAYWRGNETKAFKIFKEKNAI